MRSLSSSVTFEQSSTVSFVIIPDRYGTFPSMILLRENGSEDILEQNEGTKYGANPHGQALTSVHSVSVNTKII